MINPLCSRGRGAPDQNLRFGSQSDGCFIRTPKRKAFSGSFISLELLSPLDRTTSERLARYFRSLALLQLRILIELTVIDVAAAPLTVKIEAAQDSSLRNALSTVLCIE